MRSAKIWAGAALAGMLSAGPCWAKVVFTGYADTRLTPQAVSKVNGPAALLSSLGITETRTESRTFAMDSIGLFATTTFNDQADFLMDVTYKKVGAKVDETRLQYAYLHYHSPSQVEANVGRVALPIGYYNRNHFYPFQREAITPPVYQSAIIGLPIADHGAVLSKEQDLGPVSLFAAGYVVNGYGPTKGSTDTFRAGLGATDSLLIANNLAATNPNNKFAFGGNARISFLPNRGAKLGVSSYHGPWSRDGKNDFTMLNAYAVLAAGRLNLLAEALHTKAQMDKGAFGFFGVMDWESMGYFVEGSYAFFKEESRGAAVFAGAESTEAKGRGTGAGGREELTAQKAGFSWKLNPFVTFKAQFNLLNYTLPIQLGGSAQEIEIKQNQIQTSLTLTF